MNYIWTRGSAITERPCNSGTLHWSLEVESLSCHV